MEQPGCPTVEQPAANLAARDVRLSGDMLLRLDEIWPKPWRGALGLCQVTR